MLTIKQGLKLSAIIERLDLKITNPNGTPEQVGADLMTQIISRAHRAESEIYEFISSVKGITPQKAEEMDLVEFIKELTGDSGVMAFFKSAVKSDPQR